MGICPRTVDLLLALPELSWGWMVVLGLWANRVGLLYPIHAVEAQVHGPVPSILRPCALDHGPLVIVAQIY